MCSKMDLTDGPTNPTAGATPAGVVDAAMGPHVGYFIKEPGWQPVVSNGLSPSYQVRDVPSGWSYATPTGVMPGAVRGWSTMPGFTPVVTPGVNPGPTVFGG